MILCVLCAAGWLSAAAGPAPARAFKDAEGRAIDAEILAEEEFGAFFTAYFLIDGGGALGERYKRAEGRHAYIAWGTKSPNASNSEEVLKRAKRSGMIVESHPMEGVGHAFPEEEKQRVTKWLYETVLAGAKGKP